MWGSVNVNDFKMNVFAADVETTVVILMQVTDVNQGSWSFLKNKNLNYSIKTAIVNHHMPNPYERFNIYSWWPHLACLCIMFSSKSIFIFWNYKNHPDFVFIMFILKSQRKRTFRNYIWSFEWAWKTIHLIVDKLRNKFWLLKTKQDVVFTLQQTCIHFSTDLTSLETSFIIETTSSLTELTSSQIWPHFITDLTSSKTSIHQSPHFITDLTSSQTSFHHRPYFITALTSSQTSLHQRPRLLQTSLHHSLSSRHHRCDFNSSQTSFHRRPHFIRVLTSSQTFFSHRPVLTSSQTSLHHRPHFITDILSSHTLLPHRPHFIKDVTSSFADLTS